MNTFPRGFARDTYKGRPAVRVTTGTLSALFLPEDGGKLASICAPDGFEFLCQNPAEDYARLTYDGDYVASECASWDDMFPTVDPYTPEAGEYAGRYAGRTYPDHCEVCRLPMDTTVTEGALLLSCASRIFPLVYAKAVTIDTDGALCLSYTIENNGQEDFPYIWAAHCMLRGTDDLVISTPYADDTPVAYMFGPAGREDFPRDRLMGYAPGVGAAYKYYYTAPTAGGFVGGTYTASGHAFEMDFRDSAAAIPYIGVWINNGEFRDYYNIALECASAPYDSPGRAMEKGVCSVLPAGETLRFTVRVRVQ